jgi:glycosyltransferase involved in cell wall biosynthesis
VRLFQNARYYPSLRPRVRELTKHSSTFAGKIDAFLNFRYSAAHILQPIDQRAEWAFFTNGDDESVQRLWAREHGLSARASRVDILKAQIEEHRTDVFYNHDATGWDDAFVRNLPGCVKASICWHATPFLGVPFASYDMVVCNFPSVLAEIEKLGARTDYFSPAYDPEFAPYAERQDRPIDVMFVGGYSRHHQRRAEILEAVAQLAGSHNVVYHLDRSRLCKLAESPLGQLLPLSKHRRPPAIRTVTQEPKFGRDYYEALSKAKIVLNGSIDMSGNHRGNMRCFEALGSQSLLLSDKGSYPDGMKDGETLVTYDTPEQAVAQINAMLENPERRLVLARAGHEMVSARYSKKVQWRRFEQLVASI